MMEYVYSGSLLSGKDVSQEHNGCTLHGDMTPAEDYGKMAARYMLFTLLTLELDTIPESREECQLPVLALSEVR